MPTACTSLMWADDWTVRETEVGGWMMVVAVIVPVTLAVFVVAETTIGNGRLVMETIADEPSRSDNGPD